MDDPFYAARRCVSGARRHLEQMEDALSKFAESNPYKFVTSPHPLRPGLEFHKVQLAQPIPQSIEDSTWDAIGNLRAALDNVCYAAALASGIGNPKKASFPFVGDVSQLDRKIETHSTDIPQYILSFIRQQKPYRGGANLLWALNRMANTNKHRLLVPVVHDARGMTANRIKINGSGPAMISIPKWDTTNNELLIGLFHKESKIEYDLVYNLDILFGDVEVVGGMPVVQILDRMGLLVHKIVEGIALRSSELGASG